MTEKEIREQFNRIESTYKTYLENLLILEKKRDILINNFSQALKRKEIEHLENKFKTV